MPEHLDEPWAGHHCYRYCRHWQQPAGVGGTAAGLPHPLLKAAAELLEFVDRETPHRPTAPSPSASTTGFRSHRAGQHAQG